ncbi:hypothetical protein DENIS_0715 [Desulfonema ishimotonii]|uniref:Uncharacterized protein n=1 Tax=Desulfonema ishimotonii TaxID=45657 RepID=A0A401FS38_9BACT|nr:hypothetical protein [Desulfonema ishimotonii]GBC59774.1 hypothetical protein DENIS_0715 [Desulfonema ishimotonii]
MQFSNRLPTKTAMGALFFFILTGSGICAEGFRDYSLPSEKYFQSAPYMQQQYQPRPPAQVAPPVTRDAKPSSALPRMTIQQFEAKVLRLTNEQRRLLKVRYTAFRDKYRQENRQRESEEYQKLIDVLDRHIR